MGETGISVHVAENVRGSGRGARNKRGGKEGKRRPSFQDGKVR